ncbi:acyltransferase family protein [Candidatus Pelagibacter sp.]|uniref:acyltransferase family protein n=1 Tax=Candidatus Pelagibacter sp. TaxID=2024849 RepID=UPI003F832346
MQGKITEIQYLRAIAVLFVFLFHLDKENFPGGFIGVDIFFLISGFLMLKILNEKKYSLAKFYTRRLKRIFPALIFILLISVFFSANLLFLEEFIFFIDSLLSAITFYSNLFFWIELKSYFTDSEMYPLLHTWSISLEMQFYFIVPLIYLFLNKFSKQSQIFILLSIILISLILSILFSGRDQSFYLLPYRINEFLIGSLLYLFQRERLNFNSKISDIYYVFLSIILIIILFNFDPKFFPNYYGFFICVFISLFLLFNNYKITWKIINFNFFQNVGKISYSFFLVHWPIITFSKLYIVNDLSIFNMLAITLITIVFSYFTFIFIEDKFYRTEFKKYNFIILLIPIFLILCTVLFPHKIYSKLSINKNQNIELQKFLTLLENDNPYKLGIQPGKSEIILKNNLENILVFGDSHANDIYLALKNKDLLDKNFIYISLDADCFEILSSGMKIHFFDKITKKLFKKELVSKKIYEDCNNQILLFEKTIKKIGLKKILISMKWLDNDIENLDYLVNYFSKYFSKKNIFIFSRRLEIPHIERSIIKIGSDKNNIRNYFQKNKTLFDSKNKKLKSKSNKLNVNWVDINELICIKKCKFFHENKLTYSDSSHFTLTGGKIFINRFLKKYNLN